MVKQAIADAIRSFMEMAERSTVTQGLITMVLIFAYAWMVTHNMQVPDDLAALLFAVVGFFFGAKAQNMANESLVKRVTRNQAELISSVRNSQE
jgi:uncharacterized membrane protein YfcA